jgi:hypothetical protein
MSEHAIAASDLRVASGPVDNAAALCALPYFAFFPTHEQGTDAYNRTESVYIKIHIYFRWCSRKVAELVRATHSLIEALTMNSFLETTFVRRVIRPK